MKQWEKVLVGLLLGDGCVWTKNNKTAILYLKYSPEFREYLEWLKNMLSEGLEMSEIRVHKTYGQCVCVSKFTKKLMKWRLLFYRNNKKVVPKNIDKLLVDPLNLAIWYQDDGCLDYREKYHFNAKLATYCFDYDECQRLSNALMKNFNIKTGVHKSTMRGKVYYHLYVYSQSMNLFIGTIKDHIHPLFHYKIKIANTRQQSR